MDFSVLFHKQQDYFNSNITKSLAFRQTMLTRLEGLIVDHQSELETALFQDLHKSAFERYATEIGFILRSIRDAKKSLKSWMKVQKEKTPLAQFGAKSYSMYEPLGTVLIIGPFNYPFQLLVEPLIGAIAAGNTIILKPSEHTSHTEALIETLFNATFEPEYCKVVTGAKETVQALLELPFDHIFFTGSTNVGRIVYQAAAKHLTPVTLELGGKSPTIIEKTAKLELAARRIVYGKYLNAGQTCIAPDYIYVDETVQEAFIEALKNAITTFYPAQSDHLGHIVSSDHFNRLERLIDETKVVYRYPTEEALKMSPVIMKDVTWKDAVMQEEIFGPILPVLSFKHLNDAIQRIKAHPKPLALYLFTEQKAVMDQVFSELSFGNGAINDTLMQVANPHLPFGGVGHSGFGAYHGKTSFERFSHRKTYMKKSTRLDPKFLYPPYDEKQVNLIKKVLK